MRLSIPMVMICLLALAVPAQARTVCTLVADPETRAVLVMEGDCESRVTPASTFKLTLAVMAFDAGIITSPTAPVLSFREGDPDWGANWREDTNPTSWMVNSTLWYSQRLAEMLGAERLTAYARGFGFGNADFSGDLGFGNGLERAWISSSLEVSPLEQAGFISALLLGQLPVSAEAHGGAISIVESAGIIDGWTLWGKTGSAFPRNADRSFNYARGWGWYVGWAEKAGKQLVFVRLIQDEERHEQSGGQRTRASILSDWPTLAAQAGH